MSFSQGRQQIPQVAFAVCGTCILRRGLEVSRIPFGRIQDDSSRLAAACGFGLCTGIISSYGQAI